MLLRQKLSSCHGCTPNFSFAAEPNKAADAGRHPCHESCHAMSIPLSNKMVLFGYICKVTGSLMTSG